MVGAFYYLRSFGIFQCVGTSNGFFLMAWSDSGHVFDLHVSDLPEPMVELGVDLERAKLIRSRMGRPIPETFEELIPLERAIEWYHTGVE